MEGTVQLQNYQTLSMEFNTEVYSLEQTLLQNLNVIGIDQIQPLLYVRFKRNLPDLSIRLFVQTSTKCC